MLILKSQNSDVDSIGFSEQYPEYYFDAINLENNKYYCALKTNHNFTLPKNKLNIWIPIKINDTTKYNFIKYSSNSSNCFVSNKYPFLNKYYFYFIECFDNDDIYYVLLQKNNTRKLSCQT